MNDKDKKPPTIQLAIQGGGAKVVGLIAALEVVQELERKNALRVTRIAATSAGAIAGALYAAGVSMTAVKQHLKNLDVSPFAAPSRIAAAWRLLWNKPIFDPKLIRKCLGELFDDAHVARMTLSEFAPKFIPLHITSTDVTNSRPYTLGPGDHKNVIDAVLDSAAVPFLFRMPSKHDSGANMADGGVCENLPVAPLKEHEATDGPIVAISFALPEAPPEPPTNLLSYAAALASAAIDNSVAKAKRDLEWILELKLDVPSFEFESSLRAGLEKYALLKEQTAAFFGKVLEEYGRKKIRTDPWSASSAADNQWEKDLGETMKQIGWMYHVHHLPNIPRIARSQLIVIAHSLERTGAADSVTNIVELHAMSAPVSCYRFALTGASDRTDLLRAEVEVMDSAGNAVKFANLPMLDYCADAATKARSLLVVFQTPLDQKNGPYTVRLTEQVKGFVAGLLDPRRNEDEAYIATKRATLESALIIVHWPKSFGDLTDRGEVRALGEAKSEIMLDCGCRKLTRAQLGNGYAPPGKGYHTAGWTCDAVPAPAKFSVRLFGP
ncbi:MAG TPA: patatin-like phospholipase family protein [Steroidobacteraceae bacterium]|nr:patatin-like phospholipase family protein [Steroidobacteraceae bacterium]